MEQVYNGTQGTAIGFEGKIVVVAEKFLTNGKRSAKMRLVNGLLAAMVSQALDGRSVHKAAEACGLPDHQLRDVVYGKSKRPDPAILEAIAEGLGLDIKDLALAAYGIVPQSKSEPVPA